MSTAADHGESAARQSSAFLSGQGIPVPIEHVESELGRLWGPSAERAGGPDLDNPAVTRVALANLVVSCLGPDSARIERTLETVVSRYPCRAIVLRQSGDPERRVLAEVSAQCHLPAPGQPQVCSERIVLSVGARDLDLLPGAVRPLLESELPMVLWWTGDPRAHWSVFLDLNAEASRLIADLPDPARDAAAVRHALDPALSGCRLGKDLAWFGAFRWRELVAQFFDTPDPRAQLARIHAVEVDVAAPQADARTRVGAWLVAWLAGQLGWEPCARAEADGGIEAHFQGPAGPVQARVRTLVEADAKLARIAQVRLRLQADSALPGSDPEAFGLVRVNGTPEVRIEVSSSTRCSLARLVHAREFDEARRVSAALESRRFDPAYDCALPHLLWLIGA